MKAPDLSIAKWRKSSYTSNTGGQCVELADAGPFVVIRDSKNPDEPTLAISTSAFTSLTHQIKATSTHRQP